MQLVVRRLPIKQFDDSAAQTPDVRCRSRTRELNDFRSHPVRGTDDAALMKTIVFASCNTKIGKLDETFLGSENVGAFDISMDDTLLVEVEEPVEHLGHVECNQVFRKFTKVFAD